MMGWRHIMHDDPSGRFALAVSLVAMAATLAGALLTLVRPTHATWRPEMAQQFTPEQKRWFGQQHVPGGPMKGNSCCSDADGTYAQEDIRGDHYWTRYHFRYYSGNGVAQEGDTDWVQVPDEAVIREPNRHGAPAVWYYFAGDKDHPVIRCYAPGVGI